jgi:chlorite dismutase
METPDTHPYHHYLFFQMKPEFYQLSQAQQDKTKQTLSNTIRNASELIIAPYTTLGFKTGTIFMLWCRAQNPSAVQDLLQTIQHTQAGAYLELTHTYFGIVRASQYSGRTGKPEQIMQNFTDRLPYFVLYPFTKTPEWYLLDFENRRSMMGQHIKIGVGHPDIRQCLLYSYGLADYEFVVSYETPSLEQFQDLVMELRKTMGRTYTLSDTPIFTCLHKPLDQLLAWL